MQAARVAQRRSLEEASKELRIPLRQLEALEHDQPQTFSATVYALGALRAYAKWLGLEERPLERAVASALREKSRPRPLKLATFARWHERVLSGSTVLTMSIALGVLVVGGYVVWQVNSFWRLPHLTLSSPAQNVVEGDAVTVSGMSERDARVQINGETIMLREDNSFEHTVPIEPGITIVRVEAHGPSGRVAVQEKHLLKVRSGGTVR